MLETNLWMGAFGVGTGLHYDLAHNMYASLSGVKRFWLFAQDRHARIRGPGSGCGGQQVAVEASLSGARRRAGNLLRDPGPCGSLWRL